MCGLMFSVCYDQFQSDMVVLVIYGHMWYFLVYYIIFNLGYFQSILIILVIIGQFQSDVRFCRFCYSWSKVAIFGIFYNVELKLFLVYFDNFGQQWSILVRYVRFGHFHYLQSDLFFVVFVVSYKVWFSFISSSSQNRNFW